MADIRIKDLPTTATQTASDDFIALDGTVNGTRKIDASAPSFKTSVTSPSIVAPTTTPLTLTGGSTGASLVLGQGATAGNATITPTGTGVVAIAGTGSKLTIAGTTASTSTTTGALQVTGGVGVSGAGYFGGSVVCNTGSQPIFSAAISGTSIGSFSAFGSDVYIAVDQNANGNMIFRRNSATESMRIAGSNGAVNITSTVSASSSTAGALTVGNGTAATNVAIGGGNVNAGGTLTIAGTVIHTLSATPASASATGTVGTMSWDANYIYICTAANTWKRVAIATW